MIKTNCVGCGCSLKIDNIGGNSYYFFGYDTMYYGDSFMDERDPHEVVGYYCKVCGEGLRERAEAIGYERI